MWALLAVVSLAWVVVSIAFPKESAPRVQDSPEARVQSAFRSTAQSYFARTLRDPESARYQDWSLHEGTIMLAGEPFEKGYVIRVNVNAKNGFGGYTGFQPMQLFMSSKGTILGDAEKLGANTGQMLKSD